MRMIYEFRIYQLHPGKLEAFKQRFEKVTLPFFAKHGIRFTGFWECGELPEGTQTQVVPGGTFTATVGSTFGHDEIAYLVVFESLAQRDEAWSAFVNDEEWIAFRGAEEAQAPLVVEESFRLLQPTDFSPAK